MSSSFSSRNRRHGGGSGSNRGSNERPSDSDRRDGLPFHFSADFTESSSSPMLVEPPPEDNAKLYHYNTGNDQISEEEGSISMKRCVLYALHMFNPNDSIAHLFSPISVHYSSLTSHHQSPSHDGRGRRRCRFIIWKSTPFLFVGLVCLRARGFHIRILT